MLKWVDSWSDSFTGKYDSRALPMKPRPPRRGKTILEQQHIYYSNQLKGVNT